MCIEYNCTFSNASETSKPLIVHMNDTQLTQYAQQVQRGDRASFRPLVDLLSKSLIAVALRYTQDWDNAMDITQETWLKVYSNIDRYDPRYPVRTWIGVIHRNNCLSFLRSARNRAKYTERYTLEQEHSRNVSSHNPLIDTIHCEFGERIRSAMKQLSHLQQTVFSIVAIEQVDQQDAARILGMKRSTLRSTLHFARKRLAQLLRDE